MKLYEVVNAREAFKLLTVIKFNSFSKSRDIAKTFKTMEEDYKFFKDEQMKLVNEYIARDENNKPKIQNGNVIFKDEESKQNYNYDLQKLLDIEVDKYTKIDLTEKDFLKSSDLPTPEQMIQLDSFINWV